MKRKKILFISSWFPNKIEPTNGNFVQRHAEAVAKIHDVEILHAIGDFNQKQKYLKDDQVINGIRTCIVYYKNSKNPAQNFLRRMRAYKIGFSEMQVPDLVHANVMHNSMLFAVYLKKRFKIPFVITEHWTVLREVNSNRTPFITKYIAKLIGNTADKVLPVSNDLKRSLKKIGIKTGITVIPNVVDTKIFKPKKELSIDFTFIHVSNLIPRKNSDKILKVALKLLSKGYQFNLQLGGDGNIDKLQEEVRNAKAENRIEIFGIQTISQIAERMQRSDCFILFSDDENQPCVIAEAFASGLQVISTNVGGISEFFPENAGILLTKVDEDQLFSAMRIILEGKRKDNIFSISQYAKDTFSEEIIAQKFSEVYDDVCKNSNL
ncbi:glycosyltransferase family 4 protein [Chryseobacterium lathyri]|uniref:glycosyltransferase family 4 protein n=1 Tax=Chryseobacterium lathyri TaxID=395933 RepID=UPI002789A032|nr:glycosyltransferase family 4 protein [Chryseobacterium lathyri]MDQ0067055.1 glycosyltransferase involved in cell wall biosynthesis [Chryseobacterium lathyri]